MRTIEIKNIYGVVIFTYECDNDSIDNILKEALEEAMRSDINLTCVELRGADLTGINLSGVIIRSADMRGADLTDAEIRDADFTGSDMRGVDLTDADLTDTDLTGVDLRGADISGVNFRGVDLSYTKGIKYAQCSFDAHGECGRVLMAIKMDNTIKLFCGCLDGTKEEFIDYIMNNEEERYREKYKASRLFALDFVLRAIEM